MRQLGLQVHTQEEASIVPLQPRWLMSVITSGIKPGKSLSKSKRKKKTLVNKAHISSQDLLSLFVFVPPHFPPFITVIWAISPRPPASALPVVLMLPRQERQLISSVLDGWMMFLCVEHMEFSVPSPPPPTPHTRAAALSTERWLKRVTAKWINYTKPTGSEVAPPPRCRSERMWS